MIFTPCRVVGKSAGSPAERHAQARVRRAGSCGSSSRPRRRPPIALCGVWTHGRSPCPAVLRTPRPLCLARTARRFATPQHRTHAGKERGRVKSTPAPLSAFCLPNRPTRQHLRRDFSKSEKSLLRRLTRLPIRNLLAHHWNLELGTPNVCRSHSEFFRPSSPNVDPWHTR